MKTSQIVGIGLTTLDILFRLPKMPTWENIGLMDEIKLEGGGPTGTALVAASRLGAQASFIGTAGNDWIAKAKLQSLHENHVDVSRVVLRDYAETQIVVCYVDSNSGEREFTGTKDIFRDPLKIEELDKDFITQHEFLMIDGFHYEASLTAANWMHGAGKKVVLDAAATKGIVSPRMVELVKVTDILICGNGFAQALTGLTTNIIAGKEILGLGPKSIVMTEGGDGSTFVSSEEYFHTPAFQVDVVDTTGAGDVFHGAFVFGLLQGWDNRKSILFATAVSAIQCTSLGGRSAIPAYSDVIEFLSNQNIYF